VYYLSPTKSLTDAYQLKVRAFPESVTIPASETVTLTYEVWVPASIPAGSYYLGILCKTNNDIFGDELIWHYEPTQVAAGIPYGYPGLAYCYPSPAYLSKGDTIHFALFPANAEISILLPSGNVIKKFTSDENGYIPPWDGSTDRDGKIGSGVYLVYIDSPGCTSKKLFKILILR
jgi:hypothetical protein